MIHQLTEEGSNIGAFSKKDNESSLNSSPSSSSCDEEVIQSREKEDQLLSNSEFMNCFSGTLEQSEGNEKNPSSSSETTISNFG